MPGWAQITIVLGAPFALSGVALFILARLHNPKLDTPLNLSEAWRRVLGSGFSPHYEKHKTKGYC